MSLAAETRRAVDRHPFLRTALQAGVVNYTAAARYLDIDGEIDAIATALRRYAEELPTYETESRDVRVRMESGIGPLEGGDERGTSTAGDGTLVTVGGTAFGPAAATEPLSSRPATWTRALAAVLARLSLEDISPSAAAVADGTLVVVVARLEGANALRAVEDALDRVDVRME